MKKERGKYEDDDRALQWLQSENPLGRLDMFIEEVEKFGFRVDKPRLMKGVMSE